MKLSLRIGLGFASILALMLMLGGMALWNMKVVEKDSLKLANAYIPEVDKASEVERHTAEMMYSMRGYGYSEEAHFLSAGREALTQVRTNLDDCLKLAETQQLPVLKEQTAAARKAVENYAKLVEASEAAIEKLAVHRQKADSPSFSW